MYARNPVRAVAGAAISLLSLLGSAHADWAPTKAVEFVVPFSPGGASDQMARVIQAAITKHELVKTPIVIQNKAGASGAEGILDVKSAAKDPHKVLVASTGIFTVPMATGLPFNWKDLTPVGMVAQDEFVLWVNAATPYQTAGDYLAEVKKAPGKLKMGGTSSKREDQVITAEVEHKAGVKFTYIPYKGGGEASTQLVGKHIDSNTNNPSESIARRAGAGAVPVLRQALGLHRQGHRSPELGRHSHLQGAGAGRVLQHAARLLPAGRRDGGADQVLRRPAQEGGGDARVQGVPGEERAASRLHGGPAVRGLPRQG
jgi:hypothetical protein